ncbi:hypothetical protein ABFV99_14770 [Cytobacillus horneckiae]|uniref:hypothetical protein n=1 Tax=Cytobacillus horneckiae TaxID=549687 RepID=UPI0034CEC833
MKGVLLETKNNTYRLRFSINAQAEIEELLGVSMFSLMSDGNSIKKMRTMICIGINHGEKQNLTYDQAGEIMDEILEVKGLQYLSRKLSEAIKQSYGDIGKDSESEEDDESKKK